MKLSEDSRQAVIFSYVTPPMPLKMLYRRHVRPPIKYPKPEKDCMSVLTTSAKILFVRTTARSSLAQKIPVSWHAYFGMQVRDVINH